MIRAGVLLGVGAVAGVCGSRWVRRRTRELTPVNLAGALAGAVAERVADARDDVLDFAADFAADVRVVADRRERELLAALNVPAGIPPARPEQAELSRGGARAGRID